MLLQESWLIHSAERDKVQIKSGKKLRQNATAYSIKRSSLNKVGPVVRRRWWETRYMNLGN